MRKLAVLTVAAALPLSAAAAPENYTFDPYHTYVSFSVDHLGFSTMYGRFNKTAGKMTFDAAAKTGSLEITVETASIDTGDSDRGSRPRSRDEHLRNVDFFNVNEFPRMTFKSGGAIFSGDNPVELDGQVTLLGVTKPLALRIDRWKCGPNPFSKKPMCGGNASGSIKRTDFGMKYGVPAFSDEIRLMVEFEAYKD
jgi:polyisoprenoid-binding protein YceI